MAAWCLVWGGCSCLAGRALAADAVVMVPAVAEPYRSELYEVIDGLRKTADVRVAEIPLAPDRRPPALPVTEARVLIALGGAAVEAAGPLARQLPVVVGAVLAPVGEPPLPGISLEPDPGALFDQLLRLRPGVRTVHWLYRPAHSGWLLERAQAAARQRRLQLMTTTAEDARAAARGYQEILSRADGATEALWLPLDPALVDDDSTLPDILARAWANNVVVFSGALQHVAHGVLFALFPNNRAMGAELARLALARANGQAVHFEPNRQLRRAINRRTAERLGVRLAVADYDLVLPAP